MQLLTRSTSTARLAPFQPVHPPARSLNQSEASSYRPKLPVRFERRPDGEGGFYWFALDARGVEVATYWPTRAGAAQWAEAIALPDVPASLPALVDLLHRTDFLIMDTMIEQQIVYGKIHRICRRMSFGSLAAA